MDRPQLLSIGLVGNHTTLSMRALIDVVSVRELNVPLLDSVVEQVAPLANIRFFPRKTYRLKVIAIDDEQQALYIKDFVSHQFGLFQVQLPAMQGQKKVNCLKIFETSIVPGVECFLGHYFPNYLPSPSKIIISDFDKTLVETRYSTPKEMLESLRKPLSNFPTIPSSVQLIKSYIEQDYLPFIVSASPHFYERSVRDWLYQHEIHTSNIYLKDYRKIFSIFDEELTTKDIKQQGFYKLAAIVDILLMCQLPDQVVLVGDGFESDMLIYLTIRLIIVEKSDPYQLWKELSKKKEFTLNAKQKAQFLLKVYELASLSQQKWGNTVSIYIRCNQETIKNIRSRDLGLKKFNDQMRHINFYTA